MKGFIRRLTSCKSYYCNLGSEAKWLSYKGWAIEGLFFACKRQITVIEQSGNDLTDYQVLVELNSSNFDFSHANEDGSDIRFHDGSNFLNYWTEKWDNVNQEAKIWVKVPSIPANGTTTFYMYYGNPNVTSASNGENIFEFFEDFETNKGWDNIGGGEGTYSIENSIITMTETNYGSGIDYVLKLADSFYVEGNGSQMVMAKILISNAKELHVIGFATDTKDPNYHYKIYGSQNWGLTMEQPATSEGEWQIVYAILDDFSGNCPITIGEDDDATYSAEQKFDWILIRKYTDPEPSVSVGNEETP